MNAADLRDHAARLGRVALITQGLLYIVVGILATTVANGNDEADPSQRGALKSLADQPFGRVALVVVVVGLVAHALWRLWLAVIGEPGDDEDAGSLAKRAANLGRAAIYGSFVVAGLAIATNDSGGGSDGGSGGGAPEQSTGIILGLPAGPWIVVAIGLGFVGVAVWNVRRAVTQSYLEDLDLSRIDAVRRPVVAKVGAVGYCARAASYALIGWFLFNAGRQRDASETRGLDQSLHELTTAPFGPFLLFVVAVGLVLFGAFRILDGLLRKDAALTHS